MNSCEIVAHRGASGSAPENTLLACERALAAGATMLELDIRRTADGQFVVVHDSDLERLTGRPGQVAEQTLAAIQAHDVGEGERVPALAEVLEQFRGRTRFNLELKFYGHERELVEMLRYYGMFPDVIVSSFIHPAIYRVKLHAPAVETAALLVARVMSPLSILHRARADWLNQYYEVITPDLVQALHRRRKRIAAWTVNQPEVIDRLLDMGVDAIISDYPERVRERIDALAARPHQVPGDAVAAGTAGKGTPERISNRAIRGLLASARLPVRGLLAGARLPLHTLRSLRRWRESR